MEFEKNQIDYSLYLVTDSNLIENRSLERCVEQAIRGGCTLVQLREKELESKDFLNLAHKLKTLCDREGIPLLINDRIDIALGVDAAGVHVGQNDFPVALARKLLGSTKLLGVSVQTKQQALQAEQEGADYLGVGAMYSTNTKKDATLVSLEELEAITNSVSIPVVAIGGMNKQTIPCCAKTGIDGVAVVSALLTSIDITGTAKELKTLFLDTQKEYKETVRGVL
ncbi:thiamine phosphate synthase [uncultured Sphaerochaeta sp.]|uniref:thiamine phosphate synthase n=1 Tax=uncultured Sphaerochaeta sp. TaxID=886478 RepID=UPI002A0A4D7B|nr:thiamine phosphate synthase [uncultured Sphaerochaeta sp.]